MACGSCSRGRSPPCPTRSDRCRPSGRCRCDHSAYFRASIVEQLPDPLTPLFADVIDVAVTRSITALMNEVLGRDAIRAGDVALPTINGYAYYRYSNRGMAHMLRSTPAALRGAYGKRGFGGRERWETVSRPAYQAAVDGWRSQILTDLSAAELLDGVAELVEAGATYYTAVQTIIPIAASTEMALTWYYDAFVRRDGDPPASALLLGYDSEPIRAERSLWDLARWAGDQPELADWLTVTPAADIVGALPLGGTGELTSAAAIPGAEEFAQRFGEHLAAYGHAVYNLDFANPVPADEPAPLVDVVRLYLSGQAGDPYERQRRLQQKRDAATVVIRRRLDPVRRSSFDALLRRAQAIAPIREDALADVGLAWPQLRRMLAELGRRLVAAGAVDRPEDVYWCRRPEIEAVLDAPQDLRAQVEHRREIWRGQRRATPPQLLPQGTWMDRLGGDDAGDHRRADGRRADRDRRQHRPDHSGRPGAVRAGRLRAAAARGGAGRLDHDAGLDLAVRPSRGGGHRHRRSAQPQLDRRPRVRHPGGARHSGRHPPDRQRAADHRGRRPGPGLSGRPGGCAVTGGPPPTQSLADRWRHRRRARRRGHSRRAAEPSPTLTIETPAALRRRGQNPSGQ